MNGHMCWTYIRATYILFYEWNSSLNYRPAQSAAEMSKDTRRLLTLQMCDRILPFVRSLFFTTQSSPIYSWDTRTSDCQRKINPRVVGYRVRVCIPRAAVLRFMVFPLVLQISTEILHRNRVPSLLSTTLPICYL